MPCFPYVNPKTIFPRGLFLLALCFCAVLALPASVELDWDAAPPEFVTPGGYGRAKKLSTGEIALVYSRGGSVYIKKKTSAKAATWGGAVPAAEPGKDSGYKYANAEMTELADGRLLYTWNARPIIRDGDRPYKIMASFSNDGGATWGEARDLYSAGNTFRSGCWEPCPIQLPGGEIQIWFADESTTPKGDQVIAVLRSRDQGKTWLPPFTASYRKGSRDGMPVPVWLQNGRGLVAAIEDNGIDGRFKPVIVRVPHDANGSDFVDGKSPRRWHTLRRDCRLPSEVYAGAPYLIQLNTGETVLSVQSTEGRQSHKDHKYSNLQVYVGDASAKNFAQKTTPFPDLPAGARALWNSLCQTDDDTLIAVASLGGLPEKNGIWIATAKIRRSVKQK